MGVRDLEDVRGAVAARLPRALRHRRRSAALLRRLRPEPEPDVVGRARSPSSSRRRSTASRSRCTATAARRAPSPMSPITSPASSAAVESARRRQPRRQHRRRGRDHHPRRSPSSSGGSSSGDDTPALHRNDPVRVLRQVRGRRCAASRTSRRARDLLGFEPKVDLETGLRETIRLADGATPDSAGRDAVSEPAGARRALYIVVPVFNEAPNLERLFDGLRAAAT